jgi:23S rRNA (guanosine2251-2'-O)-methyltransferase
VKHKLRNNNQSNSSFWIGGKHTVEAAINNSKRKILRLVLHEKLKNKTNEQLFKLQINYESNNFFNKIFNNEIPHQGYAVLIEKIKENNLKFYLENEKISNIISLDGITDPRNIGSIIRSAVAFNFDLILINKKDFNSKSFLLYKAASGAMEKIIIIESSNILNEIQILKKKNFWIVGMDSSAKESIYNYKSQLKNVVVFGSEKAGMRNILKKDCDYVCKIPISKNIDSLNVSNAAAVTLSILNSKK